MSVDPLMVVTAVLGAMVLAAAHMAAHRRSSDDRHADARVDRASSGPNRGNAHIGFSIATGPLLRAIGGATYEFVGPVRVVSEGADVRLLNDRIRTAPVGRNRSDAAATSLAVLPGRAEVLLSSIGGSTNGFGGASTMVHDDFGIWVTDLAHNTTNSAPEH